MFVTGDMAVLTRDVPEDELRAGDLVVVLDEHPNPEPSSDTPSNTSRAPGGGCHRDGGSGIGACAGEGSVMDREPISRTTIKARR